MIDPKSGVKLVTINKRDGTEHYLKKLAPSDWLRLNNSFRAARKGAKRGEMQANGADAATIKAEMDRIDKLPVMYLDVERWVNTGEGQLATILISLAKDNPAIYSEPAIGEAEMQDLGIQPGDWLFIAADLLNFTLKEVPGPLPVSPDSGAIKNQISEPPPIESGQTSTAPTTP